MRGLRGGTTRTTYPAPPLWQGEAMKKPRPKTRPAKPRKPARVVIGRPRADIGGESIDQILAKIFRPVAGMNHNPPQ